MFPLMFPTMSSKLMQQMKNNFSTGKPMEMNAPAAGAMNVANMKAAAAPSPKPSNMSKAVGALKKSSGIVGPML
jgi:hypothetical protein